LVALEETCPDHLHVSQANDVQINPRRLFIPDLLVITDEAARRPVGKYEPAEVLLAVEIVSPSSQSMDRVMKPTLYAKAGIPSYWMIEIDGGLTVHTYQLEREDEVYQPSGTFTDAIKVDQPWQIDLPMKRLRPRYL
jgi:Uma2 family endonuclease